MLVLSKDKHALTNHILKVIDIQSINIDVEKL